MTDNNKKKDAFGFNLNTAEESGKALKQKNENGMIGKKNKGKKYRYCYDIRGELADYEITYEEMRENIAASVKAMIAIEDQKRDAERQPTKPDGMTNLKWQKESRNKKRLIIEKRKQGQSDWNIKRNLTPLQLFSKRLDKISCRCEADEMRAGRFCDTCKLIVKINEYTLDLFKRASEGTTSYI
jgi:hypothetical protein